MNTLSKNFAGTSRTIQERIDTNLLERIVGRKSTDVSLVLEDIVDIDRDLDHYNHNQINLLNPKRLYQVGTFNMNPQLLRIIREEAVSALQEPVLLNIVSNHTKNELIKNKKTSNPFRNDSNSNKRINKKKVRN